MRLFHASLLLCGCSAIVDGSSEQCKTNDDCAKIAAGLICGEGVCTDPQAQQAECTSNEQCVAAKGAGFTCNAQKACVMAACTKHSECTTQMNMSAVCRSDGQCAPLFTPDCFDVIPDNAEKADDMYLVGFMGVVRGDDASYGLAQQSGEQLALLDLQNNVVKLPGAEGQPKRNLAMLVCDHGAGNGEAAANHLVNTLKVPVILGASYSSVTTAAVGIAAPKGVLVFSPAATSPGLSTDADSDLFFRTVPSDVVQTFALKQLVPLVTKKLRADGALAADAAPIIALPWKDDSAGNGLVSGFTTGADAVSGQQYRYDANRIPTDATYRMGIAQQIVAQKPHIILHGGTGEFIQFVVPLIEQLWNASYKPWYIVPEGDLEKLKEKGASEALITSNNLAARLVGTSPGGRRSPQYTAFKDRFPGEPGNLAEFAYDAVYMLAYAIAATNKQYPTGIEVAQGLRKTSCKMGGPRIEGGTQNFNAGWSAASRGCIDYFGPSGEVDFDAIGDTESDISVGCLQKAGDAYAFVRIDTYYALMPRKLTPYKGVPLDFTAAGWCAPFTP